MRVIWIAKKSYRSQSSLTALPDPTFASKGNTVFLHDKMDSLKNKSLITKQHEKYLKSTIFRKLQLKIPYYKDPRREQAKYTASFK